MKATTIPIILSACAIVNGAVVQLEKRQTSAIFEATTGQAPSGGGSCTGQRLGQTADYVGSENDDIERCVIVPNAACVLLAGHVDGTGECIVDLYTGSDCEGQSAFAIGFPNDGDYVNFNFGAFKASCA